jgi:hypothetical protein
MNTQLRPSSSLIDFVFSILLVFGPMFTFDYEYLQMNMRRKHLCEYQICDERLNSLVAHRIS